MGHQAISFISRQRHLSSERKSLKHQIQISLELDKNEKIYKLTNWLQRVFVFVLVLSWLAMNMM